MLTGVNVLTSFTYAQENFFEGNLESVVENVWELAEISGDDAETSEYKGEMLENITDDFWEEE